MELLINYFIFFCYGATGDERDWSMIVHAIVANILILEIYSVVNFMSKMTREKRSSMIGFGFILIRYLLPFIETVIVSTTNSV